MRQAGPGWAVTELGGRLPAGTTLGWPGLALDAHGLPAVAYTRWSRETHKSTLVLARLDRTGRVRTQQITSQGFPKSHVAPPAAPVFRRGALHVIETYGYDGAVGTIEWGPRAQRRGWSGQFLDSGIGDFPVGPLLTAVGPAGTVLARLAVSAGSGRRRDPVTRVRLAAADQADGSVRLSGRVLGYAGGRVTIYRERPGTARSSPVRQPRRATSSFTFSHKHPLRPLLYRAVYAQPKTGVPYAALLRTPVS